MRILILSDIHANYYALESVLAGAEGQYDQIVCCGDLVGYNPHPDLVTKWVRENCQTVIRGNHDKVVAGLENLDWFNEVARAAALWTMKTMEPENIEYLAGLPQGPVNTPYFQMCHGSPSDEDEYITNSSEAAPCFSDFDANLLFFGHTHLQGGFAHARKTMVIPAVKRKECEFEFQLQVDTQYMLNPGSVGQPRDGDPRAAYAIYETEDKVVTLRRVTYPIAKTIADIREAGLPDILAMRLLHGL